MGQFNEWLKKAEKVKHKDVKPEGSRDMADDLSSDYKGKLSKNGTVEPWKILKGMKKEGVDPPYIGPQAPSPPPIKPSMIQPNTGMPQGQYDASDIISRDIVPHIKKITQGWTPEQKQLALDLIKDALR